MEYKLCFNKEQIAVIRPNDSDFPNLYGRYKLLPSIIHEQSLISRYIQYSIKSSILLEENEINWLDFMEKEESKFIHLIESDKWTLLDSNGKSHPILIPNFCDKNKIVWRWNF